MSCKVIIDSTNFQPGSLITGKVLVNMNNEKNIRGVTVRLKGEEHTEWEERESHYNTTTEKEEVVYQRYTGDHTVCEHETQLRGSGKLEPGQYTFPFEFHLDRDIPSSYKGTYGYIEYSIKGKVDLAYQFDYVDKVYLNINSPINFNNMSWDLQQAVYAEDDKTVCCFCCSQGEITFKMTIPKRAYVIGESILVHVDITNLSNVNVDNVNMRIIQTTESTTHSPSTKEKYETDVVVSVDHTGVGANGCHNFYMTLDIPTYLQIYNFKGSSLFSSSFRLEGCCNLPDCHTDLELNLHLVLGHIQHERSPTVVPPDESTTMTQQLGVPRGNNDEWEDIGETTEIGDEQPPPYQSHIGFNIPSAPDPSSNGNTVPQLPTAGFVAMPMPGPSAPVSEPEPLNPEKGVFGGGPPSAPPDDPSRPSAPELPPPSYEEISGNKSQ